MYSFPGLSSLDATVINRARTTTSARSAPTSIIPPTRPTFGNLFTTTATGGQPRATGGLSGFLNNLGTSVTPDQVSAPRSTGPLSGFLNNLGATVSAPRSSLPSPSGVAPIPQVVTADGDGSSNALSGLTSLAQGIFAEIGSSGDGDVIPVAYGGNSSPSGAANPTWWILGGALALGLVYMSTSK